MMHTTTNKKVNQEQLAALQEFVAKHVEYYDVQCELVDHMANGIEAVWQEDETISFNEAFRNEIKKFGVSGFRRIAEEREKALRKRYNQIIFKHLLSFFKLPRIIGSLLAMYAVFLLLSNYPEIAFRYCNYGVLFVFAVWLIIIKFRKYRFRKSNQKFIFKELINSYGSKSLFVSFCTPLIMNSDAHGNVYYILIFTLLYSVFMLYCYIGMVYIPVNAKKYLNEVYPEYELMQSA